MSDTATKYGELYESIEGKAIKDMFCDGACSNGSGPTEIKKGDNCFAAVLLPDRHHFNYERQKPERWAHEFITFEKPN